MSLPSLKTREPGVSGRDISGLMDRDLMRLKQGGDCLPSWREGALPVTGGIDVRLAHQLSYQGNQ